MELEKHKEKKKSLHLTNKEEAKEQRKKSKMKFFDYSKYAKKYSDLGITNTYYLAYRDIPKLLQKFVKGKMALDYGCGAGRSTRFLKNLGFDTVGVDISLKMLNEAKKLDPKGEYDHIKSGVIPFQDETFDFVLSSFTFDSIYSKEEMIKISKEMRRVLKRGGIILNITSTPQVYSHNWASFIGDFPENKKAKSGDKVKVVIRDSKMIVYDYLWEDSDYQDIFRQAGLQLLKIHKPLAKNTEPYKWHAETKVAPWFVYVLQK